ERGGRFLGSRGLPSRDSCRLQFPRVVAGGPVVTFVLREQRSVGCTERSISTDGTSRLEGAPGWDLSQLGHLAFEDGPLTPSGAGGIWDRCGREERAGVRVQWVSEHVLAARDLDD